MTSHKAFDYKQASDMRALVADGLTGLAMNGVHHTARPTWKLAETITFYRDVLGLRLVHCISARGWGPEGHPDFLHFFFDSGNGSLIAFFYYLGTDRPTDARPADDVFYNATHTAWRVKTREELLRWKEMLEKRGVVVSPCVRHEVLESIYFSDPNGYPVEIAFHLREVQEADALDAQLTLQAAIDAEACAALRGERLRQIDDVWRRKAQLLGDLVGKRGVA